MAERIWFTSDNHFGHANAIKFCARPFASVEEMNEQMIERHNSVVRPGDLCYFLGDVFWRSLTLDQAKTITMRLNGQKYYVNGNHEELFKNKGGLNDLFIWKKDIAKIHPANYPHIVLCHYAMRVWEGSHRGDWHLFGHSHNGLPASAQGLTKEESSLSMDVGVDTHNWYPWSLEEVADQMKFKLKGAGQCS